MPRRDSSTLNPVTEGPDLLHNTSVASSAISMRTTQDQQNRLLGDDDDRDSPRTAGDEPQKTHQQQKHLPFWPLAVAYFFGITALFTHVALTSVVTQTWINRAHSENSTIFDEGAKIPHGVSTLPLACLIMLSSFVIPPAGWIMQRTGYQKMFYAGTVLSMASGGLCVMSVILFEKRITSPLVSLVLLAFSVVPQGMAYGIVHFYRHVAAIVGKATAADLGLTPAEGTSRAVAIVITSGALAGVAGPGLADAFNHVIPEYAYAGTYASLILVALLQLICLCFIDVDAVFNDPAASPLLLGGGGGVQQKEKENEERQQQQQPPQEDEGPRPLCTIIFIPKFLGAMLTATAAHGMMLMIMTIAPLLLHGRVSFFLSSLVIQVHVLCMYFPSLVTSKFIAAYGTRKIEVAGVVLAAAGAALLFVPIYDEENTKAYYAAVMLCLILIGLGWNLTYVAATTSISGVYKPNERFKAQSFNDFFVFSIGSVVTLVSGAILHHWGLECVAVTALVVYGLTFIGNAAAACVGEKEA